MRVSEAALESATKEGGERGEDARVIAEALAQHGAAHTLFVHSEQGLRQQGNTGQVGCATAYPVAQFRGTSVLPRNTLPDGCTLPAIRSRTSCSSRKEPSACTSPPRPSRPPPRRHSHTRTARYASPPPTLRVVTRSGSPSLGCQAAKLD